jgi:hypothetical protein
MLSGGTAPATFLEADIAFDTGAGSALTAAISSGLRPALTPGISYRLVPGTPANAFEIEGAVSNVPEPSSRLHRANAPVLAATAQSTPRTRPLSGAPQADSIGVEVGGAQPRNSVRIPYSVTGWAMGHGQSMPAWPQSHENPRQPGTAGCWLSACFVVRIQVGWLN